MQVLRASGVCTPNAGPATSKLLNWPVWPTRLSICCADFSLFKVSVWLACPRACVYIVSYYVSVTLSLNDIGYCRVEGTDKNDGDALHQEYSRISFRDHETNYPQTFFTWKPTMLLIELSYSLDSGWGLTVGVSSLSIISKSAVPSLPKRTTY